MVDDLYIKYLAVITTPLQCLTETLTTDNKYDFVNKNGKRSWFRYKLGYSPYKGCQCHVRRKSGIPLAILQICPGNPDWEDKKVWILGGCVDFFWKSLWKRGFLSKKPGNTRVFFLKKSGNPTSSMGEGKLFLE